jgi:hypothetical protein
MRVPRAASPICRRPLGQGSGLYDRRVARKAREWSAPTEGAHTTKSTAAKEQIGV